MKFVWVEGMRGTTPELWSDDYRNTDMQDKPRRIVIQMHDVDAQHGWPTLEELARKHPLVTSHEV